jgi:hypothetical protein
LYILPGDLFGYQLEPEYTEEELRKMEEAASAQRREIYFSCIFRSESLVIKKNNWSYVKTMSCSGSHLGITINIKNTKFVKDLPMIDAQFSFNQCNSFREEY